MDQELMPSIEQLRLNQLRKQNLWGRNSLTFYDIAKNHLGLHSTDYWTPYLSVFARIGDYVPFEVFQSINCGDRLVRVNAFRSTVFIVHITNLSMVFNATGIVLWKKTRKIPFLRDVSDDEIDEFATNIRNALQEQSLTMRELKKKLPGLPSYSSWLIKLLMAKGEIIRASAKRAKSNLTAYAPMSKWVPNIDLSEYSEEEAQEHLIKKYIDVFGPVTENDLTWWLSQTKTIIQKHIKKLLPDLVTHKINGTSHYMDSKDNEFARTLDPIKKPIINLLPYEDHFPKAFIDRSWFISKENNPKIFPRNAKSYWPQQPTQVISKGVNTTGEIRPSIWKDGQIIGRWEIEGTKKEKKIVMSLYTNVSPEIKSEIKKKKYELEQFINNKLIQISK
ncbi:MAG: DNA glycosylase AlkZ-like family protein [Candidatus Hodarchaeales archaeon]|jgi:hypothetical protein